MSVNHHASNAIGDQTTQPEERLSGQTPTCGRCKREMRDWPLERGDVCSPSRWAYCIRQVKS